MELDDKNVKLQKPTKKSIPDVVNRIGGINRNHCCRIRESRPRGGRKDSGDWCTRTPSKLFVADAMLRTSEANQQRLTIVEDTLWSAEVNENCSVVAVMLEKKVAMVAKSMNEFRK